MFRCCATRSCVTHNSLLFVVGRQHGYFPQASTRLRHRLLILLVLLLVLACVLRVSCTYHTAAAVTPAAIKATTMYRLHIMHFSSVYHVVYVPSHSSRQTDAE